MSSFWIMLALLLGAALFLAGIWGYTVGRSGRLQVLPVFARVALMTLGASLLLGGYNSAQAVPQAPDIEPRVWTARAAPAAIPAAAPIAESAAPVAIVTPAALAIAPPAAACVCPPVEAAPAPAPAIAAPRPAARTLRIYDELGPDQRRESLQVFLDDRAVGTLSPGPGRPLALLRIESVRGAQRYRIEGTTELAAGPRLAVAGSGTIDPARATRWSVRIDGTRLLLEPR